MKKISLIFSLLILAILFSTASAKAQNVSKVALKIPFAFDFGDKSYTAGNYTLSVVPNTEGVSAISIADQNGNRLQTILAPSKSRTSDDNKVSLLFDKLNERSVLTGVSLPNNTYTLRPSTISEPTVTKNRDGKKKGKVKTT